MQLIAWYKNVICSFSETEMKNKIEELSNTISDLRKTIFSLEQRISKEESLKLVKLLGMQHCD